MAFIQSMNEFVIGENGMLEYSKEAVNNDLLALSFKLVRDLQDEYLINSVNNILFSNNLNDIVDLFVLTFQTRNCRGGKGERKLYNIMIIELYKQFPETIIKLLSLVSHYGYYKDYINIYNLADDKLKNEIIKIYANDLLKDENNLTINSNISFASKYAPREGKLHFEFFDDLTKELYPSFSKRKRNTHYRQLVSKLNKQLDVIERKMCANTWADIKFPATSIATNKYRKALLNEDMEKKTNTHHISIRNHASEDRNKCSENFTNSIIKGKINASQMAIHTLVQQIFTSRNMSETEKLLINLQFEKIKEDVEKTIATSIKEGGIDMSNLFPLIDVSGSMNGDPMFAAIALGILISSINNETYRNNFITFETYPSIVNLCDCNTFYDKVIKTKNASWGGSTNIEKAFELIIKIAIDNHLSFEQIPDLIIFSDMQFDTALNGNSDTQLENIKKMFYDAGIKICGEPYDMPRIIFWNLRGNTYGYPAVSTSDNVQMLSGFSPAMLNLVLSGEPLTLEEDEENEINPLQTFRRMIDDKKYDLVRKILNDSDEGILINYRFVNELDETLHGDIQLEFDETFDETLQEQFINTITDFNDKLNKEDGIKFDINISFK
jgi:hypothetical protein